MLRTLTIDGFRSLLGFKIELSDGLNVLVGANGSGKSNFIAFLDFLGVLMEHDLNRAIGTARGAGAVFSRETFDKEEASLNFEIEGYWGASDELDFPVYRSERNTSGKYTYKCELKYLRSVPAVFISSEECAIIDATKGFEIVVRRSTSRQQIFETKISVKAPQGIKDNLLRRYKSSPEGDFDAEGFLALILQPEKSLLPYFFPDHDGFIWAVNDLNGYRSVTIDPSLARCPTPVSSTPRLAPTGEGLAGALYQLKRGNYTSSSRIRRYFNPREQMQAFNSIISWCKEVNPAIENVEVTLDFAEAELRPTLVFQFEEGCSEPYPFRRLSDGTVKWLVLVTILLAEPTLNVIEEPENFLHPFMQESFILLCREVLATLPTNRTLILSTHSPIILDSCKPEELTLFELSGSKTRATRVANANELRAKIESSRFGLGHYYRTGAVYGEDSGSS